MTETENENSGCRFPVAPNRLCGRPVAATKSDEKGRGAPAGYCEDPEHNRAAAWRARRAFAEAAGREAADVDEQLSTPVTAAGVQAGQLLDRTRALADELIAEQQKLAERLATIGDLDATALELETATTALNMKVDQAEARRQQAEKGLREQRELRLEADSAAEQSEAAAAAKDAEIVELRAELHEAERSVAAVEAQNAELERDLNQARQANAEQFSEIAQLTSDLAAEKRRAETAESAVDELTQAREGLRADLLRAEEETRHLGEQLHTVTGERNEQRRRAETAELNAQLASTQVSQMKEDLGNLRTDLQQARTESLEHLNQANRRSSENAGILAQLEAAKQALAAEQNHANQRVSDIERVTERELSALRAEVHRLQSDTK